MEWSLAFSDVPDRLTVTATGPARVDAFLAFLLAATADPRWRPGTPTLLDFRDLDLTALSPPEVQELAELHRPHAEMLRRTRIAVLVTRSVDYGIVRMWEAFTDDLGLAHAPFYELETAEAWLAEG